MQSLAALSSQITGLSSAFATTMASVEDRLNRLETQMRALSTLSDEKAREQPALRNATVDDKENRTENQQQQSSNSNHSEAASRLRLQIESCSWPPKPSAFARP